MHIGEDAGLSLACQWLAAGMSTQRVGLPCIGLQRRDGALLYVCCWMQGAQADVRDNRGFTPVMCNSATPEIGNLCWTTGDDGRGMGLDCFGMRVPTVHRRGLPLRAQPLIPLMVKPSVK